MKKKIALIWHLKPHCARRDRRASLPKMSIACNINTCPVNRGILCHGNRVFDPDFLIIVQTARGGTKVFGFTVPNSICLESFRYRSENQTTKRKN